MKKNRLLFISTALFCTSFINAQENPDISPYSFNHLVDCNIPGIVMPSHDFSQDIADAEVFEKQGNYPRFARIFDVNVTMLNAGIWTELANGNRVWRLSLKSNGALSTCLFFDNFFLPEGATLHVYTPDRKQVSDSYTNADNQGNELFSTEFISGNEEIIEYFEPASVKGKGRLRLTSLAHQYRTLPMAADCEVNVNCTPEGDTWQDEKRGVVRIQVKEGTQVGYCSGSLINNTALDCKRYILTAFHCGVNASTSDFNAWKFYFNYEATQCTGQSDSYGTTSNVYTGCTKKTDSDDGGGLTGSDFLLVEITSTTHPSWWTNVYWNGWNKANTGPPSGSIAIHHPNGDNKKISKTTGTATSTTYGGVSGTHWRVYWTGTTNGWGVTEGGSSGSPLFNTSSQIVGTLTGGNSYCNSVQPNGQNQSDVFGKFSFDWELNGSATTQQLKPWLDPTNSGVTSLNGGYNPCNGVGIDESSIDENWLSIYPNPANGAFHISVAIEKPTDIDIAVYTIVGQEILHKKIENTLGGTYDLDLTNQTDGVYFVQIKTNNYTVVKNLIVLGLK